MPIARPRCFNRRAALAAVVAGFALVCGHVPAQPTGAGAAAPEYAGRFRRPPALQRRGAIAASDRRRARPNAEERRARDGREQPSERRHAALASSPRGDAPCRGHRGAVRAPVPQPRRLRRLVSDPTIVDRWCCANWPREPTRARSAALASSISTTAQRRRPGRAQPDALAEQTRPRVLAHVDDAAIELLIANTPSKTRAWSGPTPASAARRRAGGQLLHAIRAARRTLYRPGLTCEDGQLSPAWRALLTEYRALHDRIGHLGQRALGNYEGLMSESRAGWGICRQCCARHRMGQRRNAVWIADALKIRVRAARCRATSRPARS